MIKYVPAPDIKFDIERVTRKMGFGHVKLDNVVCMRSYGSRSRSVLARIWSMPKIWQLALGIKPHYVIEVISERYDKMPEHEKVKTLIHELWHIPKNFTGGLKNHDRDFGKTINNSFMDRMLRIFNR